jgi:hypothetical protein
MTGGIGLGAVPSRRRAISPGSTPYGTPSVPVELKASLLLVILHYLLKNNTKFMMGYGQVKMSPPTPSVWLLSTGGATW